MNEEIKKKWVEALRSGGYRQGNQILRNSRDEFCCLGVLADVIDPSGWHGGDDKYYYEGSSGRLSEEILNSYDIEDSDQEILIEYNDIKEKNFYEIADWIENNL